MEGIHVAYQRKYHGWEYKFKFQGSLRTKVTYSGMGSITLKCNSLHYNYFGKICHYITLQLLFICECNSLYYNYFTKVMHYITITFKEKGVVGAG